MLNRKAKLQRKYTFLLEENQKGRQYATEKNLEGFQQALETIYSEDEEQTICSGDNKFAELVDQLEELKKVEGDDDYKNLLKFAELDLKANNVDGAEAQIQEAQRTAKYITR